jgi:NAD(P)H-dependent FMN reductase
MHILAISGSLRAISSNTAALQALSRLATDGVRVTLYAELGELPHFNPDLDNERIPDKARKFRDEVGAADALVICSPEYAHGVPGSLKNALDWLVGSLDFAGKPVALINTAPRATHAQASLRETLSTMAARIVDEASITLALPSGSAGADGIIADPDCAAALRGVLAALGRVIVSACDEA